MADTNFSQWNPTAANQETDAAYQANSQRTGGAGSGAIFPSILADKLFYQLGIWVRAMALAMVAKGYSPTDGTTPYTADASSSTAATSLAIVLQNILTNADLQNSGSPYAGMLVATPATTDNSHAPATTALLQNYPQAGTPQQRIESGTGTSSSNSGSVTFGTAFSATPVVVATGGPTNPGSCNIQSVSASGFTFSTGSSTGEIQWIAIGNR